jgi:hypothetical protein
MTGLALAGAVAVAWGWSPTNGERLEYAAVWGGIEAGSATAVTTAAGEHWTTTVTSRSADWIALVYPVNDVVTSTWVLGAGSVSWVTRYREGGFQQDQTVQFGAGEARVTRTQLVRGQWESSSEQFPAPEGVDDPLSAVLRLRAAGPGNHTLAVCSGRRIVQVYVADAGVAPINGTPARRFELRTRDKGVLRNRITAWFREDETRVPVRAVFHTSGGAVTVNLLESAR